MRESHSKRSGMRVIAEKAIGERGEDPHRRCVECKDSNKLDAVTGGAAKREVDGETRFQRVGIGDLSDLLNHEAQRVRDEVRIEGGAPDARWNSDVAQFAHQ